MYVVAWEESGNTVIPYWTVGCMNSRSRVQGGAYFRSSREGDAALVLVSWVATGVARENFNHIPTLVAIHRFSLTRFVSNILRGNHMLRQGQPVRRSLHGAH